MLSSTRSTTELMAADGSEMYEINVCEALVFGFVIVILYVAFISISCVSVRLSVYDLSIPHKEQIVNTQFHICAKSHI